MLLHWRRLHQFIAGGKNVGNWFGRRHKTHRDQRHPSDDANHSQNFNAADGLGGENHAALIKPEQLGQFPEPEKHEQH